MIQQFLSLEYIPKEWKQKFKKMHAPNVHSSIIYNCWDKEEI